MADITTTNVLNLEVAESPAEGDVLLLIRDGQAMQIGYGYFKGEKGDAGADGKTGQLDDVSVSRNRLIATLSE